MKNFVDNRMGVLMTILVLAVGSISGIGTAQFVKGVDGDTLKNLLGGCIYGACKNTKITGNVTGGILAGCVFAGCKDTEITGQGQPTPNTATLIVTKECNQCTPSDFTITVTGNSPSPSSFKGNAAGTTVTLGPGKYTVSEIGGPVLPTFSGNCAVSGNFEATGTISAGETQKCTITNSGT